MNLISRLVPVYVVGMAALSLSTPPICQAEMPDFDATRSRSLASGTPMVGEVQWHDNLESGWRASKESGLPMLIFITSSHCTYCDAMKKNTLCERTVRERLFSRFIPIQLRPDSNNKVLSRVEITAFPTTLLALPRGKVLAHRIGYQPVDQFHQLLSEAKSAEIPVAASAARESLSSDSIQRGPGVAIR